MGYSNADDIANQPTSLLPHNLAQAESGAFSQDGKTLFAISEGRASPIVWYREKKWNPPSL